MLCGMRGNFLDIGNQDNIVVAHDGVSANPIDFLQFFVPVAELLGHNFLVGQDAINQQANPMGLTDHNNFIAQVSQGREGFRVKEGVEFNKPQDCAIICDAVVFRKKRDDVFCFDDRGDLIGGNGIGLIA